MLTININGIDAIDRVEIAKYYKCSRATCARVMDASGIQPIANFNRYYYPLIDVLDYIDALPRVTTPGRQKGHKTATTAAK